MRVVSEVAPRPDDRISTDLVTSSQYSIPYDVGTAARTKGWRDTFRWPSSHQEFEGVLDRLNRLDVISSSQIADPFQKAVFHLAGYYLSLYASFVLEAAADVSSMMQSGDSFFDPSPEHRFLAGACDESELPPPGAGFVALPAPRERLLRLREARQTFRLRGIRGLRDHFGPDVVLVAQNAVMDRAAQRSARAVVNLHPSRLRIQAAALPAPVLPSGLSEAVIAEAMALWSSRTDLLDDEVRLRLCHLVKREGSVGVPRMAAELARMCSLRHLPRELWTPTASKYAPRLIGLAVMLRGGRAVRHGHGGETGAFIAASHGLARRELQASSVFVVPTSAFASRLADEMKARQLGATGLAIIAGAFGDSDVEGVGHTSARAGRPRVLYVPSVYRGARQHLSAMPPGPVYLDWQHRLLAALAALPIDLAVKLHPRDTFDPATSPLRSECAALDGAFADVVDDFDVLVFDRLNSTALAQSMCSAKHIVFAPVSAPDLYPVFEHGLRERCSWVDVRVDARNRCIVDPEVLSDAIFDRRPIDPAWFRSLMTEESPR